MSIQDDLFKTIHTPADAWRHAAGALRNTSNDMATTYDGPYTRGMVDAADASAMVLDHMADNYDKWIGKQA